MSERDAFVPEVCRRTRVCLLPDRHDGRCQPATRREQREIRRLMECPERRQWADTDMRE